MNNYLLKTEMPFAQRLFSIVILLVCACAVQAQSIAQQGRTFLSENALREGVQVTESGLQYMILNPGDELRAGKRDKVKVHYQGKHINGEVFDGNFGGEPATLRLNRVIDGWTEGLQLIGEGGRIVLYVPPDLGYGKRGSKPLIKSNEALIFVIDLLEIVSKK